MRGKPFLDIDVLRSTTIIRHVETHDLLGSTNDRAMELARQLPADELPAIVAARVQTAGRGRGRNEWWSAEGALTFSLLIEPAALGIDQAAWPQLSLTTAVAVCDALELRIADCGLRIGAENPQSEIQNPKPWLGIKWPNDVFLDGGKVCGILIESPGGAAPAKDRLIIGVGINVNNSWLGAPPGAAHNGVALCDVTGQRHELQAILIAVLRATAGRIDQLRTRDPQLIRAWQDRDLLAGQVVEVIADDRIEGVGIEIAHDGALVVDSLTGRQRFVSGSVRVVI
jgi:BirA family transcriptional regulator, biotin operon repressor / biotin---[acetyl-CoA-carboxylase] ligase